MLPNKLKITETTCTENTLAVVKLHTSYNIKLKEKG